MTEPTEHDVRLKAEAKGYALNQIPGDPGKYAFTRPPETTPLTDPLPLSQAHEWLARP